VTRPEQTASPPQMPRAGPVTSARSSGASDARWRGSEWLAHPRGVGRSSDRSGHLAAGLRPPAARVGVAPGSGSDWAGASSTVASLPRCRWAATCQGILRWLFVFARVCATYPKRSGPSRRTVTNESGNSPPPHLLAGAARRERAGAKPPPEAHRRIRGRQLRRAPSTTYPRQSRW